MKYLKISSAHIFAVFTTFCSVTGLLKGYMTVGLSFLVQQLIDAYDAFLYNVTLPLIWIFKLVIYYMKFDVTISPLWSYVFSLLMIKIGLDIRIDLKERRFSYAIFELCLGVFLSASFGILGGILYLDQEIWLLVTCVTALVLYEILRGLVSANLYPQSNGSYLERYKYRLRHFVLPQAVSGGVAFLVYLSCQILGFSGAGPFSLVAYIFVVGLFSLLDAALVALKKPWGEILPEFSRLKRREFGMVILYGYALALFQLLF